MPRQLRPHMPGVPFHVIARLQGKAPLFEHDERAVVNQIREQAARSDVQLLAYAVMPNHLHVVLVQGSRPLARFAQPLLRRLALRINFRKRTEGHVFERRFRALPCTDPDYLRDVIVYVHLNPVRAGLCMSPNEYRWTTHSEYCNVRRAHSDWDGTPASGLRLFAAVVGDPPARIRTNYLAYLDWRMQMDDARREQQQGDVPLFPTIPPTAGGDVYWAERFGRACSRRSDGEHLVPPRIDLRDLALRTLRDCAPDITPEMLRSGRRSRAIVAVRRELIRRAKQGGHRSCAIARFLNISDVSVSRVN